MKKPTKLTKHATAGAAEGGEPDQGRKGQARTLGGRTASAKLPKGATIGKNGQIYTAERLARLKKGRDKHTYAADYVPVDRPLFTQDKAHALVKMLMAGLPALACLQFFDRKHYQRLTPVQRQKWFEEWTATAEFEREVDAFNGGKWQDLDPHQRLSLALDKHHAEMAFYLYSHNYNSEAIENWSKMTEAREALTKLVEGSEGGALDAFSLALKDVIAGKLQGPPQFPNNGLPEILKSH